jgi:DNA-binding response OmpR family regulator/glycine cleavage system H lipoate-binding protein
MNTKPAVLIVDDESVVCNSCDRILSEDGFQVETSTDAVRGLKMAERKDYAAILLDLRMEEMDGLELLKRLRVSKPDVPVIVITGFPSPESKSVSMQRGASDYILKPFTPEEISESVRRYARWEQPVEEPAPAPMAEIPAAAKAAAEAVRPVAWRLMPGPPLFLDESWLRQCEDGQVCVGASLPRVHRAQIDAVRLPSAGDVVHRGLPLAVLMMGGEGCWTIPSPVSGTVTEVHEALTGHPEAFWQEPFRSGWIARIRPVRLGEEMAALKARQVVLVGKDRERSGELATRLFHLGCFVNGCGTGIKAQNIADPGVLMVDASSCGEEGVQAVARLKETLPELKVIVLGDGDSRWEASYRTHGIFYYAVEPFEDMEITDILFEAFRSPVPPLEEAYPTTFLPRYLSRLRLTNRRGRKVSLLVDGGLLSRKRGMGRLLVTKILERYCPLETTLTERPAGLDEAKIPREAEACDFLLILRPDNTERLPGSMKIEPRGEGEPEGSARIAIQPGTTGDLPLDFDARTNEALVDSILEMMMRE